MTSERGPFQFEPRDFFVLRTPLLSVDELLSWSADLESPSAPDETLERALLRDYARLTERLRAALARPEVREALYLASPDLYDRLPAWEGGTLGDRDGLRMTRALVRYFTRMASRPTPFGLFAGVGVGTIGQETRLRVSPRSVSRHVHLDMGYLESLMVHLEKDPAVRTKVRYQANTSISQSAGRLHYVETHHQGAGRVYTLAAVDASPEVCEVLRRSAQPTTLAELAATLTSDDVDAEDALAFVTEMIDAQLLVSDLEVPMTGSRSLDDLCARIAAIDARIASVLSHAAAGIRDIEAAPLGVGAEAYARVRALLEELPVSKVAAEEVFQVDMRLNSDVALGKPVVDEVARAADCLFRIGAPEQRPLAGFVKAFVERYDQQEVPLLEALDDEIGVGLPQEPPDTTVVSAQSAQQAAVTRLLVSALSSGATEITLTDADVDAVAYRGPAAELPAGFALMAAVSAASADALRDGDFRIVIDGGQGPSGAMFFGRFCHNDPVLASAVARQLEAEEALDPDAIHAELVHLPQGRLGNVVARPVLRRFEIPFLGRSSALVDQQLRLDDLLVSVRKDRLVLRSRRLGREVVPHLASAHNADQQGTLPAYRFLARFERQQSRYVMWWPWATLAGLPYLPRVTYGRTVLARAQWTLSNGKLATLVNAEGAARVRAVRAWREHHRVPRFVQLRDADNALFVDFENPLCVDVLFNLVKRRTSLTLLEMLPAPDEAAVTSGDGRFLHEIIVPFVRRKLEKTPARARESTHSGLATHADSRRFIPGSQWLFAKLYVGMGVADGVLREMVAPLVEQVVSAGLAERWFFLRYSDPQPHIRLRFFGDQRRLASDLLPALNVAAAPFIRDGRIWRVQLDTYEREIERYGGPLGVDLAERLFAADSMAALSLISEYGGAAQVERRALITMAGIDRLLTDFGLDDETRIKLLAGTAANVTEFHREQGARYRHIRGALEPLLAGKADAGLAPGLAALERRSTEMAPIAASIRAGLASGSIENTLEPLLLSYTHMFVNRVEALDPNRAEQRYYDFIRRFHVGRRARAGERSALRGDCEEEAIALAY